MERRMLLAVVLSFLVITLYASATGQCTPPPPKPAENGENGENGETPGNGGPDANGEPAPTPPAPAPPEPGPPAPAPEAEPQAEVPEQPAVVLQSEELEVGFTSQGGAIRYVQLRNAFAMDRVTPLDLIVPVDPVLLMGQIDDSHLKPSDGAPGGADRVEDPAGPMRRYHWTRDPAAEEATPEADVVYTFRTAAGELWRKRWIMPSGEDAYDIRLQLTLTAAEGAAAAKRQVKVLACSGLLREGSTGATFLYPNMALVRLSTMNEPVKMPFGLEVGEATVNTVLKFLGARTHYFLGGYFEALARAGHPEVVRWWATGEEAGEDGERRTEMGEAVRDFFREVRGQDIVAGDDLATRIEAGVNGLHHAWLVIEVTAGPNPVELPLYVGPISRQVLGQEPYAAVKPVIAYPAAFDIVADALLGIYDLFRGLFGNAGLAVIFMTLVVRGLMMPLSIKNQLSMREYGRKAAKLKPKIEALKKKYGSNIRKLREEQAKLYREHGVGFPMGCLMMFVQIPIFFALFSSLRSEYTLRNASFLWINDLSGPDRLIDFGDSVTILTFTIFSINILPLLMVALSIWQQRLMPKPADEQQAQQMRMMKWLPIIFAVILYNYTAALALYMVLSSVVAIIESRIVRAKDAAAQEVIPAPAAYPAPASARWQSVIGRPASHDAPAERRTHRRTPHAAWNARERLATYGPDALSALELLTVVLSPGTRARPAEASARRLLQGFPDLRRLAAASPRELSRAGPVGRSLGLRVAAAFALGRRVRAERLAHGRHLRASGEIFDAFHDRLRDLKKERFIAVLLDGRNRVIREDLVSEGILTASLVHPREVFAPAIKESAAGVLLVHNHPSGDPEPSPEDVEITRRLGAVGELVGIRVLDHVVIGDGCYVSFLERGMLS
ncbi:MAG: RadC family protein [Planctomycetota bacterium]|jgi:DNA repair protein RadC